MKAIPRTAYPALGLTAGMTACLLVIVYFAFATSVPASAAQDQCATNICLLATPTPGLPTATPVALAVAYAEAEGAQLGEVPIPVDFAYRDSRHPGWAGVEWNGQVVWFPVDGDTSHLSDLAPPQVIPTAPPVLAVQNQSVPAQPIACFDRAEPHNGKMVIVVCAPSPEERDRLWNERAIAADTLAAQEQQPLTEVERAVGEQRSYEALLETKAQRSFADSSAQTNVDEHPFVQNECNWHPPMVIGTCD